MPSTRLSLSSSKRSNVDGARSGGSRNSSTNNNRRAWDWRITLAIGMLLGCALTTLITGTRSITFVLSRMQQAQEEAAPQAVGRFHDGNKKDNNDDEDDDDNQEEEEEEEEDSRKKKKKKKKKTTREFAVTEKDTDEEEDDEKEDESKSAENVEESDSSASRTGKSETSFSWNAYSDDEDDDDADSSDACVISMRYIRQLNECFRSPWCRSPDMKAPLYHWAYFQGQGYGRVVEHSATTCLLAASMGRPCVVDLTPRDPYGTFQSFITARLQVGPLEFAEWFSSGQRDEIHEAHALLFPQEGLGHWTADDFAQSNRTFTHVLPLQEGWSDEEIRQRVEAEPSKIVLLPNWGTAWIRSKMKKDNYMDVFGHVVSNEMKLEQYWCDFRHRGIQTLMENYMYTPTDLSYALHESHVRRVFALPPPMETRNGKVRPVPPPVMRAMLPHQRWNFLRQSMPTYGAIHIRFNIIRTTTQVLPKADQVSEQGVQVLERALEKLVLELQECIESSLSLVDNSSLISSWWILADNLELGRNFTMLLQKAASNKEEEGGATFFMEEEKEEEKKDEKEKDNDDNDDNDRDKTLVAARPDDGGVQHSNAEEARGMLGHSYMAASFLDWMVLHEAQLSIVTMGAFGATGARGRSKQWVQSCASSLFQVYGKRKL